MAQINKKTYILRKYNKCNKPSRPIRVSQEMREIINYVRARYLLEGKTPPSISNITKMIAKKINKEELLRNEFIRF